MWSKIVSGLFLAAHVASQNDKVQVYIMMGQSNMLGMGMVNGDKNGTLEYAVKEEHKYPYLIDQAGNWTELDDSAHSPVRHVFVMGSGNASFEKSTIEQNMWLSAQNRTRIGPELGIGWALHNLSESTNANTKTLLLKSCIGDRALGWDLLPPGSVRWNFPTTLKNGTQQITTYAGYHDTPEKWDNATGPTGKPVPWMAGEQYDGDINRSHIVLRNLQTYYPGATDFEVAGFFWWQGDRDHYDDGLSQHYEINLVQLIHQLRQEFDAPKALFVTASLGQTVNGSKANDGLILDAMLNVDGDSGKYPEFKGNVKAVYTHPYSIGGASSSHYGLNAETYMNIGQAMGEAMVDLLKPSL